MRDQDLAEGYVVLANDRIVKTGRSESEAAVGEGSGIMPNDGAIPRGKTKENDADAA